MNSKARLFQLLQEKAYQNKEVTLASGKKSNFYIDVKRVSLLAEGSALLGELLFDVISNEFPSARAAGGLTLGSDPLATAVSYRSFLQGKNLEAFIVRKEPKKYGLSLWIEGGHELPENSPVVVLEDVVTSGGSSIQAVERVQERGWKVLGIVCIVNRQEGGEEMIRQKTGLPLYSLYSKSDFVSDK